MKRHFFPDWYFEDTSHIPEGFFRENGIRYLISDIDNTLVTYDDPLPTGEAKAFFDLLRAEGVKMAISSNNEHARVHLFARHAGVHAVHKAAKPLRRGTLAAMRKIGAVKEECAMLGDQLFTDGLAARSVGIRMILVNPIGRDLPGVVSRVKRRLEKPVLEAFLKEHAINDPAPFPKKKKKKRKKENAG